VQSQGGFVDRRVRVVGLQGGVRASASGSQDALDAHGGAPRDLGHLRTRGRRHRAKDERAARVLSHVDAVERQNMGVQATARHDTQSLTVTVEYPFHPLAGMQLPVLTASRRDKWVTVRGPDGFDLKVPHWMLSSSARVEISSEIAMSVESLCAVLELIEAAERTLTSKSETTSDGRTAREEADRRAPTRTDSPTRFKTQGPATRSSRRGDGRPTRRSDGRSDSSGPGKPQGGR
jgi:hypothetical protein